MLPLVFIRNETNLLFWQQFSYEKHGSQTNPSDGWLFLLSDGEKKNCFVNSQLLRSQRKRLFSGRLTHFFAKLYLWANKMKVLIASVRHSFFYEFFDFLIFRNNSDTFTVSITLFRVLQQFLCRPYVCLGLRENIAAKKKTIKNHMLT